MGREGETRSRGHQSLVRGSATRLPVGGPAGACSVVIKHGSPCAATSAGTRREGRPLEQDVTGSLGVASPETTDVGTLLGGADGSCRPFLRAFPNWLNMGETPGVW